MNARQIHDEVERARAEFRRVFGFDARTMGAAGWQANAKSLDAYDHAGFDYASDARGREPFFPRVAGQVFSTLQIPTTLPTLDELLGRREYPENRLIETYLKWLQPGRLNVMTVHAEIEGMAYLNWFRTFLDTLKAAGVEFVLMADEARACLARRDQIPINDLIAGEVDGRSGTLAVQA
jgi:peptidoglycan/xylan/chitin deacetylase (PgdA/CDA1 family)